MTRQTRGVEQILPRIDARDLKTDILISQETNNFVLINGDIATVSGVESLPQKLRLNLSLQQGGMIFHPEYGTRFAEYYDAFRRSPWLDRILKLELIRLAAIPFNNAIFNVADTPLQCITRVKSIKTLDDDFLDHKLPIRIEFDVKGIGSWTYDSVVYLPPVV